MYLLKPLPRQSLEVFYTFEVCSSSLESSFTAVDIAETIVPNVLKLRILKDNYFFQVFFEDLSNA